jgi:TonB family protein
MIVEFHMPATAIVLTIVTLAAQQAPPTKYYTEGQEVRVCGEVKTIRTLPPACDTTIRVTGEEFDVVLPISVAKELSIRPQALQGAQVCFTGRIAVAPGIPKVNVSSGAAVELVSTPLDPSFGADAEVPCGANIALPRVIKEQKPQYTSDAMRAKVQGRVELQAIVNLDGTVSQARVVQSLHPDLDEQALLAVKQWRFVPGTKDGKPVPVLVTIEMVFTLRSDK